MTRWRALLGTILAVLVASTGVAQTSPAPQTDRQPTFRVQVWGYVFADFSARVQNYFDLRSRLEEGLSPLTVTKDVSEIRKVQRALARKIQTARHGAHEGDIFSPAISAKFKEVLTMEMNAATWAAIMDDNPGEFVHDINGIYPDDKPYSTVPGTILAALPPLPGDVEYRFLGRHLILLDIRATVILDEIPAAIRRVECAPGGPLHREK